MRRNLVVSVGMAGACLLGGQVAWASNVTEFPDNGSEQMGRGGAWMARASDPLAAFYNPAGLAGQDSKLTLQVNVPFLQTCFARVAAANDTSGDPLTGAFPKVCNDFGTFPTPTLGLTLKLSPRVGLGLLIVTPNGAASSAWPEFVKDSSGKLQAAPERYLLTYSNALFVMPTLAVGWEPVDNLRFGASFQGGLANAQLSNASIALNSNGLPPATNDVKATLTSGLAFVPGFTLGALWSATPMLDIGAWYKFSGPIDASADVKTYANYYNLNATVVKGDTSVAPDCGIGNGAQNGCKPGVAHINIPIPMEGKLAFRLHKTRFATNPHRRDPMSQDLWDFEVDLTWANDSAIDNLQIRFPGAPDGTALIPVNGTGGQLPPNADVPHHFHDVFGVRMGGDYNAVPDHVAIRAGAFFESQAADSTYQNIDFVSGARIGLALGATFRIPVGKRGTGLPPQPGNPTEPSVIRNVIELSLGYMHVFVTDLNNTNGAGLAGLAGTTCNGGTFSGGSPTNVGTCSNGTTPYRTNWAVNLGTITNALDVLNVGASYRF